MTTREIVQYRELERQRAVNYELDHDERIMLKWHDFGPHFKALLETGDALICRRESPTLWVPILLHFTLVPERLFSGLVPLPICMNICELYLSENYKDFQDFEMDDWDDCPVPSDIFREVIGNEDWAFEMEQGNTTRKVFEMALEGYLNLPATPDQIDELISLDLYPMPDILTSAQADMLLKVAPLFEGAEKFWPYGNK